MINRGTQSLSLLLGARESRQALFRPIVKFRRRKSLPLKIERMRAVHYFSWLGRSAGRCEERRFRRYFYFNISRQRARSHLFQVVNLDESDAGSAVLARQNRGELPRWQRREDAGFLRVLEGKAISGQLRC